MSERVCANAQTLSVKRSVFQIAFYGRRESIIIQEKRLEIPYRDR